MPKLRFKDENGQDYPNWEEYKLENYFIERSIKNNGNLELLSVTINNGVMRRKDIDAMDISSDNKVNYKLVEINDIVYNSMRMWQGASGLSPYKGIVSPAYTVLIPKDNVNTLFFSYLFKVNILIYKFKIYSQGITSDTWNLRYPLLKKIKIKCPLLLEQEKIGNFFLNIDNIIEKQQEKIRKIEKLKKGLMKGIFNRELRFVKEDYPKWEEKKLLELMIESKEQNKNKIFTVKHVLSVSGKSGIVNQIEHLGRSFAGKSLEKYSVVRKNYVVYTKSPLKNNPYGIIKINFENEGIVSSLYGVFKCKENILSKYVHYYFDLNSNTNNYLRLLINKGAKNNMIINNKTFLKGSILIPSLKEQEKIVRFLCNLDEIIKKESRKLECLKKCKKGLMQSIFI